MLCSDTNGRYNHKQNDALGYFMWVGGAKIGVRNSSCYLLDVCLGLGVGLFPSPYIQNRPSSDKHQFWCKARTQLAWHKKLPFNGEHLKLMGQVRVFGLGRVTVTLELHGNVEYVKVTVTYNLLTSNTVS